MKSPAPIWGDAGISIPNLRASFTNQPRKGGKFRFTSGLRREVSIRAKVARSHSAPSGYPTGGQRRGRWYFAHAGTRQPLTVFFDKPLKARRDLPLTFHLPTEIQIPLGSVNE